MIIAIDPGDKNIGVAMFTYKAEKRKADLRVLQITNLAGLYDIFTMAEGLLVNGNTHTFVVENFRVDETELSGRQQRGGVMFQWSEMLTSQCIGAIKYAAHRLNQSPIVMQDRGILAQGKRWCDLPLPKGRTAHLPDDKSAYIHGAHYMMKKRMIDTVDDILKFGQETIQ